MLERQPGETQVEVGQTRPENTGHHSQRYLAQVVVGNIKFSHHTIGLTDGTKEAIYLTRGELATTEVQFSQLCK